MNALFWSVVAAQRTCDHKRASHGHWLNNTWSYALLRLSPACIAIQTTVLQRTRPVCICSWDHKSNSREYKCLCLTITFYEERVWEDSKEVSSPHNRLQSSPEKFWSDTQIMTLMLFASLSGLLKHGCVKSAGIGVCAVFHALKLFRQT